MSKQTIYTLLNTINGKQYTGHLNCKIFQRAFAKYGRRSFRLIPGVENTAPVEVLPADVSFSDEQMAEKPKVETKKKKPASGNGLKLYKKSQPQKGE